MLLTHHARRPVVALAIAATLLLAACGSTVTPSPSESAAASAQASAAVPTPAASLTPVPGGASDVPEPVPTRIGTTQTDWGEILDSLPATFPAYPNADPAELPEVATAALSAPSDVAAVAAWYSDAFTANGYAVELSDPAEDGSQVLDVQADLPECRIRMTFRPEDGSTIMTILVAAACANGTG